MNTQIKNTVTKDSKEILSVIFATTRSKVISAVDVWNIQRNKRAIVQRRFSL